MTTQSTKLEIITSDDNLIVAFKTGQVSAYEQLIDRYTDKIYRLAMRITRQQEDAEEVVQEVCLAIFTKINEFQGKSAFSSWLYRVAANSALMKIRKRKKYAGIELDEAVINSQSDWFIQRSDATDVDYLSIRHELKQSIINAINTLPTDYQQIFILRDIDGYSNQDVADIMNISLATAKSRLHRARMLLRSQLLEFYEGRTAIQLNEKEDNYDQAA